MAVGADNFALLKLISYYLQGPRVMYEFGHVVELVSTYMIGLQNEWIALATVNAWVCLIVIPDELTIALATFIDPF
jgi:hypothetical protein